jgi:hypothetical protein
MSYRAFMELPRAHRWAALSAIGAAVLFVAGNFLWAFEQPEQGAAGPVVVDFYGDLSGRIAAGGALSLVSIAIFAVFAGAFRNVLIELEEGDRLLADIAFGGAVLGLAAGIGAEGINMAAAGRAEDGELPEPLALALFDISFILGTNGAGIGLGLLLIATGAGALRARALLPTWLAVVAVALGAAMLTPFWHDALSPYGVAPAFVLLPILGVSLLRGSALRPAPSRA